MSSVAWRFLHVATVLGLVFLVWSCTVPPLQVTPQPRREVVNAPREFPRIPEPDASAAEVPSGFRVEIVMKDLTYPRFCLTDR
jgi:hypothetical protein